MSKSLLSIQGVTKNFAEVKALHEINLEIYSGQIVGLVGSNGAGKTTLLRLMAGVYKPSSGTVNLSNGEPVTTMRHELGVVPESTGLYSRLTAWENIRYHSRMHGIPDSISWARTEKFAEHLDMKESLSRHTKGFSRGMKQKTALLRALAHGPNILLLDEPTAGLDITSARTVRALVRQLRDEGGTVIYSTHQLAEAQQVCDRIVIIHNGEIRADGSPSALLEDSGTESLEEAYVSLTQDQARTRKEDNDRESAFTGWWRRLFTPRTPKTTREVMESE
ncbi:MAG: ABC transporter ATP-binding protein [Candidatus Poseidoniales archaeon]|jgi:sodium transport system ATP-binding protein|tara:strand:- start:1932 stop:2765 length:834 start_codon:yes stop_codon:yes gene_type:complete